MAASGTTKKEADVKAATAALVPDYASLEQRAGQFGITLDLLGPKRIRAGIHRGISRGRSRDHRTDFSPRSL